MTKLSESTADHDVVGEEVTGVTLPSLPSAYTSMLEGGVCWSRKYNRKEGRMR